MRLHQAQTLEEYIAQLKEDIHVLFEIQRQATSYDKFPGATTFQEHRDTFENHSHILGVHRDQLRQKRNAERKP